MSRNYAAEPYEGVAKWYGNGLLIHASRVRFPPPSFRNGFGYKRFGVSPCNDSLPKSRLGTPLKNYLKS